MRARLNFDGGLYSGPGGSGVNATPAFGELIIGSGTAFASASNPSAEVIDDNSLSQVVAGQSFGVTLSASAGTLTVQRSGLYLVYLELADFSSGAASGNVQFDVQKNSAAFGTTSRMQAIRVAATAKAGLRLAKVQSLAVGDVIRAVVTSAAGNVQTVTEGVLGLRQVADPTTALTFGA